MLRRYSKTLGLILIAALLYLGDFAIELLAPDLGKIIDRDPRLKRLLWGLLVFCLLGAVFLFMREHNAPADESGEKPLTPYEAERDLENRKAMLGLVRRHWVEGVLHKSLWNEVRLILNLENAPDSVSRPCDLALRRAGLPDTAIPPGTPIIDLYRREQGELLLLGDPGSGKTTLLLEIAETLIREAEADPTQPIPVVFNLSAWRKQHTRLDEWLVEQLNQDYHVPPKIGQRWVESGSLLLLLDGLDEVAESRRAACVEAINVYRKEHQAVLRPMVVCCRTREYTEIPNLRLNGAVVIQPLTQRQVEEYLREGGKPLAGLRAVLKDEPDLYHELFGTPLMLQVAVMTYQGQTAAELRRSVTPEERRRHLWDAYIDRMFARKQESTERYKRSQALTWLGWLGYSLTRKNLQKYLIEGMQPTDLQWRWEQRVVQWLDVMMVFCFSYNTIVRFGISGIVFPLIYTAFAMSIHDIVLQPIRRVNLGRLGQRWLVILNVALFGLVFGTVSSVFTVVSIGATSALGIAAVFGAVAGTVCMGALGAGMALYDEFIPVETLRPNEGVHHTLRTAGICTIFGAILGGIGGAAFEIAFGKEYVTTYIVPPDASNMTAASAVKGAVVAAFVYGGIAVLKHYFLRLLLWRSGTFPRDITAFLDWATLRVLLQRVGGGWRFIHRSLQEHFAERYLEAHPEIKRSPLTTPDGR